MNAAALGKVYQARRQCDLMARSQGSGHSRVQGAVGGWNGSMMNSQTHQVLGLVSFGELVVCTTTGSCSDVVSTWDVPNHPACSFYNRHSCAHWLASSRMHTSQRRRTSSGCEAADKEAEPTQCAQGTMRTCTPMMPSQHSMQRTQRSHAIRRRHPINLAPLSLPPTWLASSKMHTSKRRRASSGCEAADRDAQPTQRAEATVAARPAAERSGNLVCSGQETKAEDC